MSDDKIIPFGKYKGQEIEIVRQRDPQYLQWLMQQAWFAEKFQPIYQIVVNNFAPPSEDTPAHNVLQVRFLEYDFRCAFWDAVAIYPDWLKLESRWRRNSAHLRKAPRPFNRRREVRNQPREWLLDLFMLHRGKVAEAWKWWREAHEKPIRQLAIGKPQFETTFDVEYTVVSRVCQPDGHLASCNATDIYRLTIEIKPSMGDDYPAVLRQMKRQIMGDKPPVEADYTFRFLLVDEFASSTVTLDQVRAIFKADNLIIIMLANIREQLIKSWGSNG